MASEDVDKRDEAIVLQIPPGPHLGDLVVEADSVKKAFGDRLLFEEMNFRLLPGGIIGVIGANGAGKMTSLPDDRRPGDARRRHARVGDTVVTSYVDQNRDALSPENSIFQEISGGLDVVTLGKRKIPRGPMSLSSTSKALTRKRRSRTSRG